MENEKVTLQVGDQELHGSETEAQTTYKIIKTETDYDLKQRMEDEYFRKLRTGIRDFHKKAKSSFKQKLRASGKVKNRKRRS